MRTKKNPEQNQITKHTDVHTLDNLSYFLEALFSREAVT